MSKKLDSILSKVPSATVAKAVNNERYNIGEEKLERIVAVIPAYVKREMKLYLADHFKETERTVILGGLKAIGFNIKDKELMDKRGCKL